MCTNHIKKKLYGKDQWPDGGTGLPRGEGQVSDGGAPITPHT